MFPKHQGGARAPGCPPLDAADPNPTKDAPAVGAARGSKNQVTEEQRKSRWALYSGHEMQFIMGEVQATKYLERLHARWDGPDDLAVTVSMLMNGAALNAAALRGFCRVLEEALRTAPHD